MRTDPGKLPDEIEAAIADANIAWWDEALRRCAPGGRASINEADDRIVKTDALRIAIAAAIDRAVAAAIGGWYSDPAKLALFEGADPVVVSGAIATIHSVESHAIRPATAEDPPCCRCGGSVAAGEKVHTVTTIAPGGEVTHRQVTHLRHVAWKDR